MKRSRFTEEQIFAAKARDKTCQACPGAPEALTR
jgi:hypothetical protein